MYENFHTRKQFFEDRGQTGGGNMDVSTLKRVHSGKAVLHSYTSRMVEDNLVHKRKKANVATESSCRGPWNRNLV